MTDFDSIWRTQDEIRTVVNAVLGECICYVPEAEMAIQASYSLRDEDTRKREIEALQKLPRRLPCSRRIILTYDESDTITDEFGTIEVMPLWRRFKL